MNKELKAVASRVVTNITNEDRAYLNTRDIDVPNGSLIVLGFIERVCKGGAICNAYVMMGKFDGGNVDDAVYFKDGMVLFATKSDESIGDKISANDSFMETQSWWRTPTDDEIILYDNIYHYNFVEGIDRILDCLNELEKEDICDLLTKLKNKAERLL